MFRTTLASLLCLAAAAGAQAQEGVYGGVFVSRTTFAADNLPDFNPVALGFTVGTSINKNLAVEGRVSTGLSDDSLDGIGGSVKVKINNAFGVYGKGILPLSDTASLYGLLGYTRGKVTVEGPGLAGSETDGDVSYGFGGAFAVTPTTSVNIEYARLFKSEDFKFDGLTLGLSFKF